MKIFEMQREPSIDVSGGRKKQDVTVADQTGTLIAILCNRQAKTIWYDICHWLGILCKKCEQNSRGCGMSEKVVVILKLKCMLLYTLL